MNTSKGPIARKSGLVIQEMPDELLVYDVETSKAHCLNETVAAVWNACDGRNSVSDIAGTFGVSTDKASEDIVWLAIDQLQKHDLLEKEFEMGLSGRSRRELIKKIGFASVIALPVIASLSAPSSALAAASCVCTVIADCITQTSCPSTVNCTVAGVCAP